MAEKTNITDHGPATRELARAAASWFACVAFGIAFLVAWMAGADAVTATVRSGLAAVAVRVVFPWILRPGLSVILDAMARDRAARQAQREAELAAQEAEA